MVNTNYARRGIYAPLYGVEYGAVECLVLVYTVLNARCTDNLASASLGYVNMHNNGY